MRRTLLSIAVAVGIAAVAVTAVARTAAPAGSASAASSDWAMNATIIEACSCPMFCQCYFSTQPAEHSGHEGHGGGGHFCKFNNAFKVNSGHAGAVKLDGVKFWASGDLGGDFSQGKMDWAVLTFDKSTTPEQRAAITTIVGALYPVQWNSFKTGEGVIDWKAGKESSVATIDGGKTAEVRLVRPTASANGPGEIVIKNLKYWGAPRNDGFVLMPNEVQAYRAGDKPYEFKGTNGFMITFDINSKDVAKAGSKSAM